MVIVLKVLLAGTPESENKNITTGDVLSAQRSFICGLQ